jgi:AcrR family transcriptional regulator
MARPPASIDPARLVPAFASGGYERASIDDLARLAGVAKPTLYAHGHTKDSLFQLAVEVEVERLLERLTRAERQTRGRSARDRATAGAHAILNHGAARPDGLRLLVRATYAAPAQPVRDTAAAAAAATTVARVPARLATTLRRDLTADGLDPAPAETLATAIWGATVALALRPGGERRPNRERLATLAACCVPERPTAPPDAWPAAH